MSLVKSLNAGVSGLNAFQAKMDVIGNNIANVDTAGFKSSSITFAEMMNQNLGREGAGESAPQLSNQVGLGVRVSSITEILLKVRCKIPVLLPIWHYPAKAFCSKLGW